MADNRDRRVVYANEAGVACAYPCERKALRYIIAFAHILLAPPNGPPAFYLRLNHFALKSVTYFL